MKTWVFMLLVLAVAGCSTTTPGSIRANSTAEIPSVLETCRDRFSRTERGMAFAAFQQVWPDALKSGENEEFVIYEYRDSTLYYTDFDRGVAHWTMKTRNHEYLQRVLFFFADGVLMRYETVTQFIEING